MGSSIAGLPAPIDHRPIILAPRFAFRLRGLFKKPDWERSPFVEPVPLVFAIDLGDPRRRGADRVEFGP